MAEIKKSAWRAYLAMFLLAASYLELLWAATYTVLAGLQLLAFLVAILLGMIALSLAQDDGHERGEPHV